MVSQNTVTCEWRAAPKHTLLWWDHEGYRLEMTVLVSVQIHFSIGSSFNSRLEYRLSIGITVGAGLLTDTLGGTRALSWMEKIWPFVHILGHL